MNVKGKTILARIHNFGLNVADDDTLNLPELFVDRKGHVENLARKITISGWIYFFN